MTGRKKRYKLFISFIHPFTMTTSNPTPSIPPFFAVQPAAAPHTHGSVRLPCRKQQLADFAHCAPSARLAGRPHGFRQHCGMGVGNRDTEPGHLHDFQVRGVVPYAGDQFRCDVEFSQQFVEHCFLVIAAEEYMRYPEFRQARRGIGRDGTLGLRLRQAQAGPRACVSCREGFEGAYIELVIEDSGSRLSEQQIRGLAAAAPRDAAPGSALDDLAEIHALVHGQGGHLQIRQSEPAGTSLHIYLRAATPELIEDRAARARGRGPGRGTRGRPRRRAAAR